LVFELDASQAMEKNPQFRKDAMSFAGDGAKPDAVSLLAMRFLPGAFFNANRAVLANSVFGRAIKPLRDGGLEAAIRASADFEAELQRMSGKTWKNPSYLDTAMTFPAIKTSLFASACGQVVKNQATIACALERYYLTHGSYPDSLVDVKLANGHPLPLDEMSGKPMGYRKTADGKYALWSVGFDGKDDGGKRGPDPTKATKADYKGDWVWDFPKQ
jgi:hypothetical protein